MNQTSLYDRLGGYDGMQLLLTIYSHAYKQTLNWVVSGRIAEMMVLREKSSC